MRDMGKRDPCGPCVPGRLIFRLAATGHEHECERKHSVRFRSSEFHIDLSTEDREGSLFLLEP